MARDLYRRERRRLRADRLLIARKVDRETRRRIWRLARVMDGGFTSLSRLVDLFEDLGLPRTLNLRHQVFPAWPKTPEVIAWGRAVCRVARKAHNRQAQRERMAAHQEEFRGCAQPTAHAHPLDRAYAAARRKERLLPRADVQRAGGEFA